MSSVEVGDDGSEQLDLFGEGVAGLALNDDNSGHLIDLNEIDLDDDDDDKSVQEFQENHVEYILVASFDIDRGPVMEHQYPAPISGDEHMLAELMLPDQAHVRSEDWTVFFLHKDTTADEEEKERVREEKRKEKASKQKQASTDTGFISMGADNMSLSDLSDATEEDDGQDPPLIYVLNLVNTKQDTKAKRGAMVKAMAVCTRHSFLQVYKPLLLLALQEYFRYPTIDTLAHLYNSVNSMDLSLMPPFSLLEQQLLQVTDFRELYIEKFQGMLHNRQVEEEKLAAAGQEQARPATKVVPSLPRDTRGFDTRVLYNGVPVPIKIPTAVPPETVGNFSLIDLINKFDIPHVQSPQPFAIHPHLTTGGPYTHPIIVLVNALLTQKRVVFLGHNMPSSSVAEVVLAACSLVSGGILKGYTRYAFPYTDLTKIDELIKVPGYIAGVTNPAFKFKQDWWDLMCDLSTGRMMLSKKIEQPTPTEGVLYFKGIISQINGEHIGNGQVINVSKDSPHRNDPTGDTAFMEALHNSIAQKQGEVVVRAKWRNYISRFTRVAAALEECVYGASALYIGALETDTDKRDYGVSGHGICWPDEATKLWELAANASRVEGWRFSRSYYSYIQDLAQEWRQGISLRGIDLRYQCDRLRTLPLGYEQSGSVYKGIAKAVETAGIDASDPIPEYYRALYRRRNRNRRLRQLKRATQISEGFEGYDEADKKQVVELVPQLDEDEDEEEDDLMDPEIDDGEGFISEDEAGMDSAEFLEERRTDARYDVINQLLLALPEHQGSLFYLSLGLFHPFVEVRRAIVGLLERIAEHTAGRHYWNHLDRFAKLAYYRTKRELELMPAGRPEAVGSHAIPSELFDKLSQAPPK